MPLLGALVANVTFVAIALYEESVSLHIFFLTKMWEVCGGMPLYYLGVCSYAATNAKKNERSTKLARLDGVEQIALLLGVLLSPYAFQYLGFVGCFSFRVVGNVLAIIYLGRCTYPSFR